MQPVLPHEGHYDTLFAIGQPLLQFVDGLTVFAKSGSWPRLLAVRQLDRNAECRGPVLSLPCLSVDSMDKSRERLSHIG
jgi:hypothetical protein